MILKTAVDFVDSNPLGVWSPARGGTADNSNELLRSSNATLLQYDWEWTTVISNYAKSLNTAVQTIRDIQHVLIR